MVIPSTLANVIILHVVCSYTHSVRLVSGWCNLRLQPNFQGAKIVEAKKNVEEAQSAYADQLEEKHMEKLENGLKNRQEQLNVLLERLKEHVSLAITAYRCWLINQKLL